MIHISTVVSNPDIPPKTTYFGQVIARYSLRIREYQCAVVAAAPVVVDVMVVVGITVPAAAAAVDMDGIVATAAVETAATAAPVPSTG